MLQLMLGDCLDKMGELAEGSIDLTVTSPPYDNLRTYNDSLNDWTEAKWRAVIAELYRVTKTGGVVVWVVADATVKGSETGTSFRQALHAQACGFRLHDTMIWRKTDPIPQTSPRYTSCYEFMFVWSKGAPAAFNPIRVPTKTAGAKAFRPSHNTHRRPDGSERADRTAARQGSLVGATKPLANVWERASQGRGALHPAQFPEALARDHILSWSNEGDTVLDPFTGSGTTGKMALLHGRKFIGIERDAAYFEIARARVTEAVFTAAGDLFAQAAE